MKRHDGRRLRSPVVRPVAAGLAVIAAGSVIVISIVEGIGSTDARSTGASAKPTSGSVFTASGIELIDGVDVPAAGLWPVTVRPDAGTVEGIKCVADGQYLGTDDTAPYSFGAAVPEGGEHELRCTVLGDADGKTRVRVRYTVGAGSPPTTNGSVGQSAPATPAAPTPRTIPSGVLAPTPSGVPASTGPVGTEVVVSDAAGLQRALRDAHPGTSIYLEDGVYSGKEVRDPSGQEPGRFVGTASGTAAAPIVVHGSRAAVLDGGGTGGGYALHLKGADYWRLQGFTVQSASKGIVLDGSNHNVIDGVHVTDIGAEGIHFRAFSSDNLLTNSTVDNTGVDSPNFGEGVYLGSARSNWETYSGGAPDNSDRNQIINNTIVDTAAENVDIKEGSSNGVVRANYLGGNRIASKNSADSWIDVKGNGYLIDSNHGVTDPRPTITGCGDPKGDSGSDKNPFCDGMQVHVILDGWGQNNTFTNNLLEVNAPGSGIWLQNTAVPLHNLIACSNEVTGARAGFYATNHYSP